MTKFQTFQEFLSTQSIQVEWLGFVINLVLAAILSYILSRIYMRFGTSLSNRSMFAKNFILMSMTTMLIITIVKSSLALSLGLVGALSIVRFRAAIKEPEELSYLFLTIAIGLGFGADQRLITLLAFFIITSILILRAIRKRSPDKPNLYLSITSGNPSKISLEQIVSVLDKHCTLVNLRRLNETKETIEVSLLVEYGNFQQLNASKEELYRLDGSIKLAYLDNQGIV